jgi:transporter family-2 protein
MNYITGLTAVLIVFLFTKTTFDFIDQLGSTHFLGYFGGLLGIIVVTTSTIIIKKVSVIAATMLMYAGQLLMGILIDLLRGTDLSIGKIIGCFLIIAGVYFNALVDQRNSAKTII